MAGEAAKWAATAERIFASAGDVIKDATLKRETVSGHTAGEGPTTSDTTSACKLFFSSTQRWVTSFLKGVEITPATRAIVMQGSDFAPKKGDVISVAGMDDMTVVWVGNPAEIGAIYNVLAE